MPKGIYKHQSLTRPLVSPRALKIGLTDPLAMLRYVVSGKAGVIQSQTKRLTKRIGATVGNLQEYWEAIASNQKLQTYIANSLNGIYYGEIATPDFLYVIVRILRPEVVVETGVAAGISSAFILQALQDNGEGTLYSIDFPNYALTDSSLIPEGKETGLAIPPYLKERWNLRLGKSKDLLPSLLAELGKVDIFLHDSEHTYDNMTFEYTTVWDYLGTGGLLLSHDVSWNYAFADFARKARCKSTEIYFTGVGAIIKKENK
ncbi:class I SAM-dependent methyltransferase [Patescibacteria group bacterium]|nr:class I SAM-dependent methyltransferase [Patescibacteria group bacterium]